MEETKKNKFLFEASCEVNACEASTSFFFGDRVDHVGDGYFNWIGMLYVLAEDERQAHKLIVSYLSKDAKSWQIDYGPRQISHVAHAMHIGAIRARKDEVKLAAGEVVEGWGF